MVRTVVGDLTEQTHRFFSEVTKDSGSGGEVPFLTSLIVDSYLGRLSLCQDMVFIRCLRQ